MKVSIHIEFRYNLKAKRPDMVWANNLQAKLESISNVSFSKILITNKSILAEAELFDYKTFCDQIAIILNEDCRILIFQRGEYKLYLSKSLPQGFRKDIYAKGFPTLHCGLIIERTSCNNSLNDTELKRFFIENIQCENVHVKTYKKGWKIYFDKTFILFETLIDTICDGLNVSFFKLYLDQNDSSFKDWFEIEYVVIERKKDLTDDESTIMSSLANGEGDRFGFD